MMFGFDEPDVQQVSVEEMKKALDEKHDVFILDVRTPEEFGKNRIKGAVNLSVDQVAGKVLSVIPDKQKKIYVYCLSGSRSVVAVDEMIKLGYSNVFNMSHGLLAWRVKQYPLEG